MLSVGPVNSLNPVSNPKPQETAGSVAFRGNKAKCLQKAKDSFVKVTDEAVKKFKLEQLIKTNPAEAKEVVMRDSVLKLPKDFINKILSKFNK